MTSSGESLSVARIIASQAEGRYLMETTKEEPLADDFYYNIDDLRKAEDPIKEIPRKDILLWYSKQ